MLIGIDLGGTKIEAIALSKEGLELTRKRIATPQGDYKAGLMAICQLVAEIEHNLGQRGTVGLGIPGAISPSTGLVKNANSTWLNGQKFDTDLAQHLQRDVRVANDANCFAISEAIDGAGKNSDTIFAVILGTGCGGGIVINKKVMTGRHLISGEWGHNPLPWPSPDDLPGKRCYCGKQGCIETYVSGTGIAAEHYKRTGNKSKLEDIMSQMRLGGSPEKATYDQFIERLGRGLASVINILDPHVIVLGGGVSNIPEIYQDLPKKISPWVFSDVFNTPIKRAEHGDSSGVRGAAWLWREPS